MHVTEIKALSSADGLLRMTAHSDISARTRRNTFMPNTGPSQCGYSAASNGYTFTSTRRFFA